MMSDYNTIRFKKKVINTERHTDSQTSLSGNTNYNLSKLKIRINDGIGTVQMTGDQAGKFVQSMNNKNIKNKRMHLMRNLERDYSPIPTKQVIGYKIQTPQNVKNDKFISQVKPKNSLVVI